MIRQNSIEVDERLNAAIAQVERGEVVQITRNGQPVAHIVLVPAVASHPDVEDAVAEILAFGKSHSLDGLSLKSLIEQGRL